MTVRATPFRSAETVPQATAMTTIGTGRLSLIVVFYFLMIALPIQFNLGPVFMTGVRAVLLVTTIPLTIRLFSGQLGRVLPTDVLLFAYVIWVVLTLFINSPAEAISIGGAYALEAYGSYLLARNFIRTQEQFLKMCCGLFAILIFSLPFAVYETQTGIALILKYIDSLPLVSSHVDYSDATFGRRLGLERSQVIFSHPIHYGLFCASLFSLALVGFSGKISNFWRFAISLAIFAGVVSSVSSGAILPAILQFGLMAWAWLFRSISSRWVLLAALVASCYIAVDLISNRTGIEVFLSNAALSPETAYGRIIIFEWGLKSVQSNPFIGIGLNDWPRPLWLAASVDNFWLLSAMRYGVPGFLLLATAYLFLVWKVMRQNLGSGGTVWQLRRAWAITQVALILTLCTVDVWETALSYVCFLFGSGVWMLSEPAKAAQNWPAVSPLGVQACSRYTRFQQRRVRT
jgi:O-antigen ligase